jgi:hypothetical protein
VIVIVIVIVIVVVMVTKVALTGRIRSRSAAGLTVVAAAILPFAYLDEVVRKHHAKLRAEWRVVRGPV